MAHCDKSQRFEFYGVPPGRYKLRVSPMIVESGSELLRQLIPAQLIEEVLIPESANDDDPFDLGTIPLTISESPPANAPQAPPAPR